MTGDGSFNARMTANYVPLRGADDAVVTMGMRCRLMPEFRTSRTGKTYRLIEVLWDPLRNKRRAWVERIDTMRESLLKIDTWKAMRRKDDVCRGRD